MRAPLLVLWILLASAHATTAGQGLLSDFSTARTRMYEGDASCITVAAELGPCLSAGSPHSRLTTMEEADCCNSLLIFKEANCYCLAPKSLRQLTKADMRALKGRFVDLAEVNWRCGWEHPTCPLPDVGLKVDDNSGRKAGPEVGSEGENWTDLEVDLARFYGLGGTFEDGGSLSRSRQEVGTLESGRRGPAVQSQLQRKPRPQTEAEKLETLLAQMARYVNRVVTLTEDLSIDRGEEMDLMIEVTMGNTKLAATPTDSTAVLEVAPGGYMFWVWVVGFVLAMALIASMLCASQEWGRGTCKRAPRRTGSAGVGVVVAADEVHSLRKLVV